MHKEWGHGHSLGAGVLGGLLLAGHAWTVAAAAFCVGVAFGFFLLLLRAAAQALQAWAGRPGTGGSVPATRPRLYDQARELTRTPW